MRWHNRSFSSCTSHNIVHCQRAHGVLVGVGELAVEVRAILAVLRGKHLQKFKVTVVGLEFALRWPHETKALWGELGGTYIHLVIWLM